MGSQQQFCLRWNNHQINMLGVFDHLLQSETLVDVTLACDGLSLKAHKVVLSACSPFFQHIFLENPCKHPVIILKDVKYTDLRALVDFMYRGEVNVSQDQLSALLKTAEALKVKGLAEVTGGAAGADGNAAGDSAMTATTTTLPASLLTTTQSEESSPPQPPPPTLRMSDTGQLSPPAKRKKTRQRRRSGSSTGGFSEPDESPEMQTPLEVVETKVEILEDDYQSSSGGVAGNQATTSVREVSETAVMPSPQTTAVPSAEMQINQSPQHSTEASMPINTMTVFSSGPGNALDGSASTSASLSHQPSHMAPLLTQPTSVPHLPPSQPSGVIASTSGAPSTGQGCQQTPLSTTPQAVKGKSPATKQVVKEGSSIPQLIAKPKPLPTQETVKRQSTATVQVAKPQITITPRPANIYPLASPQPSTSQKSTTPQPSTSKQIATKPQPSASVQPAKLPPFTSQSAVSHVLWDQNRSRAAALHMARTRAAAFQINRTRTAAVALEMARARAARVRPRLGMEPERLGGPVGAQLTGSSGMPLQSRPMGMHAPPTSTGMALPPRSSPLQLSPRTPGLNLPPRTMAMPMSSGFPSPQQPITAPNRMPSLDMATGPRVWQSQPAPQNRSMRMPEPLRPPTRLGPMQAPRLPAPQAPWATGPLRAPFMPHMNRPPGPQRPPVWNSQINWGSGTPQSNWGGRN